MLDILINGGRVLDPLNGIDAVKSIGIKDGRIVEAENVSESAHVINANGCIVSPGLIDVHAHLWPLVNFGVLADASCFPSCVTTAVDAGSCGSGTYECFRPAVQSMNVGVKILLNVCSAGLTALRTKPEYLNPELFDVDNIKRLVRNHADEIIGLKIRMGKETALDMGLAPLKAACRIAREVGLPLVLHSTNPAVSMKEMIDCLDAGDVLTHAYHGHGRTILEDGGLEALEAARKRGVFIDVGDAGWHINFDIMREAVKRCLAPDTIGTDITDKGLFKRGATFSLLHCMSKWLQLGMSVEQVLRCATINAAKELHLEKVAGHLTPDMPADIAIIREVDADVTFCDGNGNLLHADRLLRPMATIKNGKMVYRDIAF